MRLIPQAEAKDRWLAAVGMVLLILSPGLVAVVVTIWAAAHTGLLALVLPIFAVEFYVLRRIFREVMLS